MAGRENASPLSEHRLRKKKGIIVTPFNDLFREHLILGSWTKKRMPDYLWLGLILLYYGREQGLKNAKKVLAEISNELQKLQFPRFSLVLDLLEKDQQGLFEIVSKTIAKEALSPLTVLYRPKSYPVFNEFFNVPQIDFECRMGQLEKAIETFSDPDSNESTDLRYLVIWFLIYTKKIRIGEHLSTVFEALEEYPKTEHNNEKMKEYRPVVRSLEGGDIGENGKQQIDFCKKFWRDIGMISKCKPVKIEFNQNEVKYEDFTKHFQKVLEYLVHTNKEKSLVDDKFHVLVGSITYALKIFIELTEKSLGNSILGRHGVRTIIEILIICKYLLNRESTKPNIWQDYKLYGISKYKLVLLKARESQLDNTAHFVPPIADALVNEICWEEFIDIDLKYFDKQGIREKSIVADEKELFDLFYDYDSCFAHGLWGAVRESAMLHCDNPSHQYHAIPDINSNQQLPDVKKDSLKTMQKLLLLLVETYSLPEEIKNALPTPI